MVHTRPPLSKRPTATSTEIGTKGRTAPRAVSVILEPLMSSHTKEAQMSQAGYVVWFALTTLIVVGIIAAGISMALSSERHSMHHPRPH